MLTPENTPEIYRIHWPAILVVLAVQLIVFIALTVAVTNHSGLAADSTANAKARLSGTQSNRPWLLLENPLHNASTDAELLADLENAVAFSS